MGVCVRFQKKKKGLADESEAALLSIAKYVASHSKLLGHLAKANQKYDVFDACSTKALLNVDYFHPEV